jgi:hypothetical protein
MNDKKDAKTMDLGVLVQKLEVLAASSKGGGIRIEKDIIKTPFYTSYDAVQDLLKQRLLEQTQKDRYFATEKGKKLFDDILKYTSTLID